MKLIYLIILTIFAHFFFIPSVQAEFNGIKPIILVPENYKNVYTSAEPYSPAIEKHLNSLRNWYSDQTGGLTFDGIQETELIQAKGYSSDAYGRQSVMPIYNQIKGDTYVNPLPGYVYVVFVVGSYNLTEEAIGSLEDSYSMVFMNHNSLEAASSSSVTPAVNQMLGVLGHELAHAFGLEKSDYAFGHPCSVRSIHECEIKNGKYPPEEEYTESIVGTGAYKYPRSKLNKSITNPEVCSLYEELALNPTGQSCPIELIDTAGIKDNKIPASIISVNPNVVMEGKEITINGKGFGNKGFIQFVFHNDNNTNPDLEYLNLDIEVVSWQNEEVRAKVLNSFTVDTRWYMIITNHDETSPYYQQKINSNGWDQVLTVKANQSKPQVLVEASFSCGPDRQLLRWKYFDILKFDKQSGAYTVISSYDYIDDADYASVFVNYDSMKAGDFYVIQAKPFNEGNQPDPDLATIFRELPTQPINKSVSFHYPQCPLIATQQVPLVCDKGEQPEFGGCDPNSCGREFWRCSSEQSFSSVVWQSGDCAKQGGPNPACKETSKSSSSNTDNFFDEDGNRVPFFGIQLGNDDTGSLETIRQEAGIRLTELQDFGESLDNLLAKVSDDKLKEMIKLTDNQLNNGSKEVQACIQ